jgi:predicted O-methyltransferase YrrM
MTQALMMPRRVVLTLAEFDDERYRRRVADEYGRPQGLPTVDLLELFPSFDETVEPYACLEGGSLPVDLALLKAFARKYDACRYLEIGSWRGESAANVASVAAECYSISLSEAEMREAGFGDSFIATSDVFSKTLPNVTHIGHDSRSFDFGTLPPMDLVFVDGDHSYEGVRSDTLNAFKVLRDQHSVIVWHDYARTTEREVHWDILAAILDGCPREKRGNLYHVSNTMCAIYAQGTYSTSYPEYPQLPDKTFAVHLSVTRPR